MRKVFLFIPRLFRKNREKDLVLMINVDSDNTATFLLELYRKALSLQKNELYEYFLDHAVKVTKSTIGFFHFFEDDEKTVVLTTWNKQALKNCKANYAIHYPLENAGNLADSIRLKHPVIYNDFKTSPNQKGLPDGHATITRMLSFPLIENDKVIAIFGVGNKDEPYIQDDVLQLELVSNELNKIIKQKRAEAEVLESKEKYQSLFENMLDGFAYCEVIFNDEGQPADFVYLEVNTAFETLTGLKKEAVIGKRVTQAIPGIKEANPELFDIYGRVASTGKNETFEVFFKPLNAWFSISVYSPRKGYFAAVFENVTDRKKAQEALREGEERWETTVSSIGDAVIATDLNGNVIFMNNVAQTLTGWRLEDAKDNPLKHVFHIINEFTREEVESPVTKVINEGLIVGLANHTILIRKDGSEVPIDDSGAPIKNREGKTAGVVLVFRDITERKKADDALRESEERLKLKLDSVLSPDVDIEEQELANIIDVTSLQAMMDYLYTVTEMGFALIDLKGTVLVGTGWQDICTKFHRINVRTLENCVESDLQLTSGLKRGEIRLYRCKNNMWDVVTPMFIGGKHVGNLFFGQFFFENETVDRSVFAAQAKKFEFNAEEYLRAFDSVPRFSREKIDNLMVFYAKLAEMISKLSYSNLKLAKGLSNQTELQEKLELNSKNLEELVEERTKELTLSSLYARNLIEASLDPLVTISVEGKITDANKATELATGRSKEELIGSDFSDYFIEPEKAKIGYKRVFTEGLVRDYPLAIRHRNGKVTDVLYNATVYTNDAGEIQGVFAAARDISELKKAEEETQESVKKLKDAERLAAIGATAGMVGHDIRNPQQAITSDIYLAKTELAQTLESVEKKNALESLTEIEKNVEYINKIVADLQDFARPLKPNAEETDLKLVIEALLKKNGLPENVKVTVNVEEGARKVLVDSTFINRIMYNLVNNAVQAMPKGGELTIYSYRETNDVLIAVKDTGVGIPEAVKSKLFTPMFTTKSKGQGFGLAVIKRMTESLGGTVSFESQEGKGTTFIIRFPPYKNNERRSTEF